MSRRPVTALTAAALLLLLSGCEKPTPGVTLASGRGSVHKESTRFCFGGPEKDCLDHTGTDRVGVLRVHEGEPVAVDVDSELADNGWYLYDVDSKARSGTFDLHHFSYTPSFQNRPLKGLINLEVRSTQRVADDARVTGLWRFQLVQQ